MQITAAMVKTLRERTGAGMMECKKALVEAEGDIDLGADNLRKAGQAKADKKASRVAVEGTIAIVQEATKALIIEVNCETDFVSSNQDYTDFAKTIAGYALSADCDDPEAVLSLNSPDGVTVEEMRRSLITAVGENVQIRRLKLVKSAGNHLGVYLHGGRIGVIVDVRGGDEELAKDIAMHIAASRPAALDADHLPAELLDKEREIIRAQVAASGKAPEIQEKMIPGMVNKYLKEVTLLGQAFVKQPDLSVAKHLEANGAEVLAYQRFEVGEGLEIDSD